MTTHQIVGDDAITEVLNTAMEATIQHLIRDELLTKEEGEAFLSTHVCMCIHKDGGFVSWLKRRVNGTEPETVLVVANIN